MEYDRGASFPVTVGLLEPFQVGLGYRDLIFPASPAAGANLPVTVEARNTLRVLGALATLTTDANAANRVFSLDFLNARGVTFLRNFAPLVITANQAAIVFHWHEQVTTSEWAANTPVKVPVSSVFLEPGSVVQFTLDNKQVGDTITAALLVVERFDEGPTGYPLGYIPEPPEALAGLRAPAHLAPKEAEPVPFPPASEQG